MTNSRAQELVEEVVRSRLLTLGSDPDDPETLRATEHIIDVCQEAISLELAPSDEVYCRVMLAAELRKKMALQESQELGIAFSSGISNAPTVLRIVTEFETALKRDAETGGEFFGDPVNRGAYLTEIEQFWLVQCRYLEEAAGNDTAITYLQQKISSLNYLQGTFLPALSLELSELFEKVGNKEVAIQWLHHACNAEVSELDSDSVSATSKRTAQNKLTRLSQPANVQKGGCFIATAVYGDDDVAEVRFLRTFRDEILLKTHSGRLFVSFYYSFSPFAAQFISKSECLKTLLKTFALNPLLRFARLMMK